MLVFFFFKQKTAYELRISDWSSDVCSSDLEQSAFDRNRNADIRAGEAEYPVLRPRRISCRKGHESLGICLNHKIVDGDLDRSAIIHPLPEFQQDRTSVV